MRTKCIAIIFSLFSLIAFTHLSAQIKMPGGGKLKVPSSTKNKGKNKAKDKASETTAPTYENKEDSPAEYHINQMEKYLGTTLPKRFGNTDWTKNPTNVSYAQDNLKRAHESLEIVKDKDPKWKDIDYYEEELAKYDKMMEDFESGNLAGDVDKNDPVAVEEGPQKIGKPYDGPAKYGLNDFYRYYNRYLDRERGEDWITGPPDNKKDGDVANMEKGMATVKEKDSSYDTAPLQRRLDYVNESWEKRYEKMSEMLKEKIAKREAFNKNLRQGPVEDNGKTSPLHSSNVKKVVFSGMELDAKAAASQLSSSYKISDKVWARIFSEKSLGNYYREYMRSGKYEEDYWKYYVERSGSYSDRVEREDVPMRLTEHKAFMNYKIYVDGKQIADERWSASGEEKVDKRTSWTFNMDKIDNYYDDFLPFGNAGTHKVKVEIYTSNPSRKSLTEQTLAADRGDRSEFIDAEKIAEGEYTMAFTAAEQKAYRRERGMLLPKAGMKNSTIEGQIKSAFQSSFEDCAAVKKVVIMSSDWSLERHPISGIVLSRDLLCEIAFKGKDGNCYIKRAVAEQEKDGSYGKLFINYSEGNLRPWRIHCGDVFDAPRSDY